jgi:hypothetical protein
VRSRPALFCSTSRTLSKGIDESAATPKQLHWLFEAGNAAAFNAEYVEEIIVEAMGFTFFVVGISPFIGEPRRARPDFTLG